MDDIWIAPHFLLTFGVLIAIAITQGPFVRAILREQRRARMLREAERASGR